MRLRIEHLAAVLRLFVLLDLHRVLERPCILPHTRHLPRHFRVGRTGANSELSIMDLGDDFRKGPPRIRLIDDSQLITEAASQIAPDDHESR